MKLMELFLGVFSTIAQYNLNKIEFNKGGYKKLLKSGINEAALSLIESHNHNLKVLCSGDIICTQNNVVVKLYFSKTNVT